MNKRKRFKVFHRDGFQCQYCGVRPTEALMHVDHIVARSKGGTDDIENLVTACQDCNLGKTNIDLKNVPKKIRQNVEDIQERREQLEAFYQEQRKIMDIINDQVNEVALAWNEVWEGYEINASGLSSVRNFLRRLSFSEVIEALDIATRYDNPHTAFRYFCGVCHTKIKQQKEALYGD